MEGRPLTTLEQTVEEARAGQGQQVKQRKGERNAPQTGESTKGPYQLVFPLPSPYLGLWDKIFLMIVFAGSTTS